MQSIFKMDSRVQRSIISLLAAYQKHRLTDAIDDVTSVQWRQKSTFAANGLTKNT